MFKLGQFQCGTALLFSTRYQCSKLTPFLIKCRICFVKIDLRTVCFKYLKFHVFFSWKFQHNNSRLCYAQWNYFLYDCTSGYTGICHRLLEWSGTVLNSLSYLSVAFIILLMLTQTKELGKIFSFQKFIFTGFFFPPPSSYFPTYFPLPFPPLSIFPPPSLFHLSFPISFSSFSLFDITDACTHFNFYNKRTKGLTAAIENDFFICNAGPLINFSTYAISVPRDR